MATLTLSLSGDKRLTRQLRNIDPSRKTKILRDWLLESAFVVQEKAQNEMIRGGKNPPVAGKLTSRTGTGRRSISVFRSGLPKFIEIGTDLRYMNLHETGGEIQRGPYQRRSSSGTTHRVKRHSATYPKRPFLVPGYEKSKTKIAEIFRRKFRQSLDRAGVR